MAVLDFAENLTLVRSSEHIVTLIWVDDQEIIVVPVSLLRHMFIGSYNISLSLRVLPGSICLRGLERISALLCKQSVRTQMLGYGVTVWLITTFWGLVGFCLLLSLALFCRFQELQGSWGYRIYECLQPRHPHITNGSSILSKQGPGFDTVSLGIQLLGLVFCSLCLPRIQSEPLSMLLKGRSAFPLALLLLFTVLGLKPRALNILGKCSSTEPSP